MKTITFKIQIKASKEKVWNTLWDDSSYRKWTEVFSEGSHVKTDWKEGGRILFLNGQGKGMYSIIEKKDPFDFMSFRHLGEIEGDKETRTFKEQSTEKYTLTELDGGIELKVDLDTEEEYQDYLNNQFPIALKKVKELAEK